MDCEYVDSSLCVATCRFILFHICLHSFYMSFTCLHFVCLANALSRACLSNPGYVNCPRGFVFFKCSEGSLEWRVVVSGGGLMAKSMTATLRTTKGGSLYFRMVDDGMIPWSSIFAHG